MRIAQCLEYPLALRGGVSVLVETLSKELSRQGHELVLVSPDSAGALQQSDCGGLFGKHFYWNPKQASTRQAKQLAQQLKNSGVDVAHFHAGGNYGWGNRVAFRSPPYHLDRLGVRSVWTSHLVVDVLNGFCGPQKPLWFKLLLLPFTWLGKIHQLKHVKVEVAVSQHDFHKLRGWYWPLKGKIHQIYHSRLSDAPPAPAENRERSILNVGHIAWRKGQHILVEAFANIAERHPDWTLQLAGDANDEIAAQEIQRIIQQCNLQKQVSLLGARSDAIELMANAGIYVQPSFWEALGLALQEAMFTGCACIGSRAGGIPELISHQNTGLLVEPGNVSQLSEALEQLISHPRRRYALGAAAASSIREKGMTTEAMTRKYLELYAHT